MKKLELNTEYPEPNEQEIIDKLIVLLKGVIEQRSFMPPTRRDVHVKGHAAVKAEFIVEPDLPKELRVGVFREPRTYPAWIRLSNANQDAAMDIKGDIRGFALKLTEVEGEKLLPTQEHARTQDFIFLSTNLFLTKDAADFHKFVQIGALSNQRTLSDYVRLFWFMATHFRVGIGLLAASRKFANLLEMEWFSATPYLFGARAVKYGLKPWRKTKTELPTQPTNNFLRERLKQDLERDGAGFDFMIQFQTDPYKEPIENALVPWNSPFRKIATIKIPRQSIDSPEQMTFCDNLSFNPWHSLPEHRPLGSANRARKAVYLAISDFRRTRNGVPTAEPTGGESF